MRPNQQIPNQVPAFSNQNGTSSVFYQDQNQNFGNMYPYSHNVYPPYTGFGENTMQQNPSPPQRQNSGEEVGDDDNINLQTDPLYLTTPVSKKKKGTAPVAKRSRKSSGRSKTEKNRESAQKFRQRQRDYMNELEQLVTTLSEKKTVMNEQVRTLQAENEMIKKQRELLRVFIQQALVSAYPVLMQRMQVMVNNENFANNLNKPKDTQDLPKQ
jgi:hypothetical protein